MSNSFLKNDDFQFRHNGSWDSDYQDMLKAVNAPTIDALIDQTIPKSIRLKSPIQLPEPLSEFDFIQSFKTLAQKNKINRNFIGMGYYGTITPPVILRNILENPGWYTAYTPYQAEIAQGRLEALINFQTMVIDLTGMEIANASLLDEGTAAAEAMAMLHASKGKEKKEANVFIADKNIFPQTLSVLSTRAKTYGIELKIEDINSIDITDPSIYGVLVQYPNNDGEAIDYTALVEKAHAQNVTVAFAADLMSLVLLKSPGSMGADVVIGSTQRFGVPMGYGGPHAAYFATHESYKRLIPGRIIGASLDKEGNSAYRMALQTREQHIRREKATSNICTAQVLLAVMAGMYAVYHGPKGLKRIANKIHNGAQYLAALLRKGGIQNINAVYFDTLKIKVENTETIRTKAEAAGINFRYFGDGHIGIAIDEVTSAKDLEEIASILTGKNESQLDTFKPAQVIPASMTRVKPLMEHPVFNQYQTEHEMLRYMKRLENKDLSLVHSMISLGSCTMKLNSTTEMIPVTWPEFGNIHPFAPASQAEGYHSLFADLEKWLCEITGFDRISFQPNSGAQGEYAGLLMMKSYFEDRGEHQRNITLIPSSAHGTNPASAVMAGTEVVIVKCDEKGNIDTADLKEKCIAAGDKLFGLMVTYPSTHGVYEEGIIEICDMIHEYGGQVYMDGANMNAQVGLTSPAIIGADVCHLNLHKTFCIPHGGGGPGMGPIGVAKHLSPFLPSNPVIGFGGEKASTTVSAAQWGSASILPISYAYIRMMGSEGLTNATKIAILNANYIKARLEKHYPILYSGKEGRCAHEMIVDCRGFKKNNVEVEDIAKRLMDYGYHAPTISFPVPGTMMIEPTESETKEELDRFCDALISIREEIEEIIQGKSDSENNVLKNAPHTAAMVVNDAWDKPYSREKAAFPLEYVRNNKFWPSVARVDNAYGDRNLFCSCLPIEV